MHRSGRCASRSGSRANAIAFGGSFHRVQCRAGIAWSLWQPIGGGLKRTGRPIAIAFPRRIFRTGREIVSGFTLCPHFKRLGRRGGCGCTCPLQKWPSDKNTGNWSWNWWNLIPDPSSFASRSYGVCVYGCLGTLHTESTGKISGLSLCPLRRLGHRAGSHSAGLCGGSV